MIPYVRLFIPEISVDKKRRLIRELTEGLVEALRLPQAASDWCTIHLFPLKQENIAVGGQLACDHAEPSYLIEVVDREISVDSRLSVVEAVKPILMRHLGLRPDQSFEINFRFIVCEAKDFAIGGQFLNEYHERHAMAQQVVAQI